MNSGYTFRDFVASSFAGMSVVDFYAARYSRIPRNTWHERISKGLIRLNGDVLDSGERVVAAGDRLEYFRPPWEEPAAPTELPVLFEDEDLLVVNKPAGLPVLPGGGFLEKTVVHLLRTREARWQTVSPLHCLDRGTSGLLLLGKSREARSALGRDFMRHRIGRVYLAVLQGWVEQERFSVEVPIGQEEHPRLGPVEAASERGKASRTDFEVLARDPFRQVTLTRAMPHTGRTHQIRIHAAYAGHPLEGEPFYVRGGKWDPAQALGEGDCPLPGACGFRLHSWKVRLTHPRTSETMQWICPPPEGFWAGENGT